MPDLDMWTGVSKGVPDPEDPEVVTVAWSVREGVQILEAEVFEKTMLKMRIRIAPGTVVED